MRAYGHTLVNEAGDEVNAGDSITLFNDMTGIVMEGSWPAEGRWGLSSVILSFNGLLVNLYPEVCGLAWVRDAT